MKYLILNSICCWHSFKAFNSIAIHLDSLAGTEAFVLSNDGRNCTFQNSPSLSQPKELACRRNREHIQETLKDTALKNCSIEEYINFSHDYQEDILSYSENLNQEINYKGHFLFELVKGTYSKLVKNELNIDLAHTKLKDSPATLKSLITSSLTLIDAFHKLFSEKKFNCVILFNGYFYYENICRDVANRYGVRAFALERSMFKNYWYISPNGFVGNRIIVKNQRVAKSQAKKVVLDFLANTKSTISQPPTKIHEDITNYVLFIGQVPFDTVISYDFYSFPSILDAVEVVYENCKKLGLKLIYKGHPVELLYGDSSICNQIKERYQDINVVVDEYSIDSLIEKSSFVITVNSQAGMSALLNQKKVITLGKVFYNEAGAITATSKNLSKIIEEVNLSDKKNSLDKIYNFMYNLIGQNLIPLSDKEDDILPLGLRMIDKLIKTEIHVQNKA